jgi:hypothetical protein
VRGGTLLQLVANLLTPGVDEQFTEQFLLTLPMTTSADRFFQLCRIRYQMPHKPGLEPEEIAQYFHQIMAPIQVHVLVILKRWILDHYEQIKGVKGLHGDIHDFLSDIHKNGFYRAQIEELLRLLAHREFLFSDNAYIRGRMTTAEYYEFIAGEIRPASSYRLDDALSFERIDPELLARQWTYIDSALILDVDLSQELFNRGWLSKRKLVVSPSVVAIQERVNQMAFWTASKILLEPNLKARTRLLGHFI